MKAAHPTHPADLDHLFPGDSRVAVELRAYDWAGTPLGSPQAWPENLRAAIREALLGKRPANAPPLSPPARESQAVPSDFGRAHSGETETDQRRSEDRLRRALQIETVGVIFLMPDGRITEVNDALLRMCGYTRNEMQQGDVQWDEIAPGQRLPRTGPAAPHEGEYVCKGGTRRWALFASTQIDDAESVEFIIDITAAKLAEEEFRRYRQDLEMLAHERTAELDAVIAALREEAMERERAEEERHELLRQLVTAQEEERRRISRELHDEIGQHLTALMLGLKSMESTGAPGANAATLKQMQCIAERLGHEVHELALKLRPTALDDLGLLRTLSNYIDEWSARARLPVDFHSTGLDGARLPAEIESTLYRIVQEALNNVLKHARANRIGVILERRPGQAVAIVEDDGCGFDIDAVHVKPGGPRLGLLGMKERAALVGGEFSIESSHGRGTTVFVRIPLPPQKPEQPR